MTQNRTTMTDANEPTPFCVAAPTHARVHSPVHRQSHAQLVEHSFPNSIGAHRFRPVTEVTNGLSEGDHVIVSNQDKMRVGRFVKERRVNIVAADLK